MRIRTLFIKAFNNSVVESVRDYTVALLDEMLEEAREEHEFDFVARISHRFPMRVIQRILGVDDTRSSEFFDLGEAIATTLAMANPPIEQLKLFEESTITLNKILSELIEEREKQPTGDLLSNLVHARDNLDRLSHDELLAACQAVITGGAGTTAHMLAICVNEISRTPALVDMIRRTPGSEKDIVSELLRYPSLVKGMVRIASQNFEWHGAEIKEGDLVFLMNISGNVNPEVFPNPFKIDPERRSRDSLAFGPGFHHCIGNILAKMELEESLSRIFRSFDVDILVDEPEFVSSYIFRGFDRLPVRFTAV